MFRTAVVAALMVLMGVPAVSQAHQGNPNMQSVIRSVTPKPKGLSLDVLNRDDRFELVNRTGEQIVIEGYNDEPYARLLANGDVEVNTRSPAYYLNDDRYGDVPVPKAANAKATPSWKRIAGDARFQWHDHRMHYMGKGVPAAVKDKSKRQKVFDYSIPIHVGSSAGAINGTLFWTPQKDGGPPVGAIVALALILLALGVFVIAVRRRRGTGDRPKAQW